MNEYHNHKFKIDFLLSLKLDFAMFMIYSTVSGLKFEVLNGHDQDHSKTVFLF